MSSVTAPLRQLTHKNILFQWEKIHTDTVMKIKELLVEAPVLIHYDATKPLRIQCEASLDGFGACLLQEGKPIAYASRTLIDAEKRYANIERELCAIVYAVEKFNYLV